MTRTRQVAMALLFALPLSVASDPGGPALHESVAVTSQALYPSWRHFLVTDAHGDVVRRTSPDDFAVWLVGDGKDRARTRTSDFTMRLSGKPVALTFVVDVSTSMVGTSAGVTRLARECILRLRDDDRIRLITFGSDARRTEFIRAADYKRASVLQYVRRELGRRRHGSGCPACLLQAMEAQAPGRGRQLDLGESELAELASRCQGAQWVAVQAAALDGSLAAEFRNGGATLGGERAMAWAIEGHLGSPNSAFLPAYDATPGLVIVTDVPPDAFLNDVNRALLDVLLVQHWLVMLSGTPATGLPGRGRSVTFELEGADALAQSIVSDLRSTYELEIDLPGLVFTRPGGIEVECISDPTLRVVMPESGLPPRDMLRAVSTDDGSDLGRERRRRILLQLESASESTRTVVRALVQSAVEPSQ